MITLDTTMIGGKREFLSRCVLWSGTKLLLDQLPNQDLLLVLNYHRIGDAEQDPYDPDLFSATAAQLDEQISYLKRQAAIVTLQEALHFLDGSEKARRCRVLITFDDGYLDNYTLAYPVLRSHGVQGVFFLATGLVGSTEIPWWDSIAYLVKTGRKRRYQLHYPRPVPVDLDEQGLGRSLRAILAAYTSAENTDAERFVRELREQAEAADPARTERRFLNWEEAREMIGKGMAVGSHTHSHQILGKLAETEQLDELRRSRAILQQQLGIQAESLAYPVGTQGCFSEQTQSLAEKAGYRIAFSFYGGLNRPAETPAYDVKRIAVGGQSGARFQVQTSMCRAVGKFWP